MKILVVSPHTDDETLGAGGFLLKHADAGDELYWLNVTNVKEEYGYTKEEESQGREEIERVAARYRMKEYIDLQLEPAGLDRYRTSELVQMFSGEVRRIQPDIVILPYSNDVHSDHKIVFEAAYSSTKSFRYPSVTNILCMESISDSVSAPEMCGGGYVPNYYVDISGYLEEKIAIMKEYKNEIKESPFPRNEQAIRGLAKYRAAACNVEYAEAFRVLKEIEL